MRHTSAEVVLKEVYIYRRQEVAGKWIDSELVEGKWMESGLGKGEWKGTGLGEGEGDERKEGAHV